MPKVPSYVDPTKEIAPLRLKDAGLLLTNPKLPLENGYAMNADGMWHVAAETYMKGVTGPMIDWWFGWITNTDQYKMWHPTDHVYSAWSGPHGDSTYIGGHHLVKEYIGKDLQQLRISFKDPSDYFGPTWKADFEKAGCVTAICARVGFWTGIGTTGLSIGHVIHLVHNEADGVRMRSRFWLGDIPGVIFASVRSRLVPEAVPKGLQRHASEEMTNLAGFLPDLYAKEIAKVAEKSRL